MPIVVVLAVWSACAADVPPAGGHGPYLAARPEAFEREVVGDGHCVAFQSGGRCAADLRVAQGRPGPGQPGHRAGHRDRQFEADGTYTSRTGNHVAIYLGQDEAGIWVYDQWQGQPVHKRRIRSEGGAGSGRGSKSNDGKLFAAIE